MIQEAMDGNESADNPAKRIADSYSGGSMSRS